MNRMNRLAIKRRDEDIRRRYFTGKETQYELARAYNTTQSNISRILNQSEPYSVPGCDACNNPAYTNGCPLHGKEAA